MLSNLRDFAIILWVVMQGLSWWMPDAYGLWVAQTEQHYIEWTDKLGLWAE